MVYMIIKRENGQIRKCWQAYWLPDFRQMVDHVRAQGEPEKYEVWEISCPGKPNQKRTVYRITDEKYDLKGLKK